MFAKTVFQFIVSTAAVLVILTTLQCAEKKAAAIDLPKDILGVSVGMNREPAQNRLKEIGKLLREDKGKQEVWVLKENLQYGHLAVGYNAENRIQFVTAIAKPNGETGVKPEQIAALNTAKSEINGPNYRYSWEAAARENNPAYSIIVQGNQPESVSLYTMTAVGAEDSAKEAKEREK